MTYQGASMFFNDLPMMFNPSDNKKSIRPKRLKLVWTSAFVLAWEGSGALKMQLETQISCTLSDLTYLKPPSRMMKDLIKLQQDSKTDENILTLLIRRACRADYEDGCIFMCDASGLESAARLHTAPTVASLFAFPPLHPAHLDFSRAGVVGLLPCTHPLRLLPPPRPSC